MKLLNCRIVGHDIDPAAYQKQDAKRGTLDFAMSPSSLKVFRDNPRRWVMGYESPRSESKDWGNIMDTMVSCPDRFAERYCVRPETYPAPATHDKVKKGEIEVGAPLKWNANAKICEDWDRQNLRGREAISKEEYNDASYAYSRLLADETIGQFISESLRQVMVVGECHHDGIVVPLRCLIDLQPDSQSQFSDCLGDTKTSRNASVRSFNRFAYDMGYHIQAAFDLDLFNAATGEMRSTWCLIVQENYRPFETARHILSQDFVSLGRMQYTSALERYVACLKAGKPNEQWPGYNDPRFSEVAQGWSILEPEEWMMRQVDEMPRNAPAPVSPYESEAAADFIP